jgi:hypothetical protein
VNGALYGVAESGGSNYDRGVVYRLSPDADGSHWTYRVMHRFCESGFCEDGEYPQTALTYDGAETGARYDGVSPLYGVVPGPGIPPEGIFYSLTLNGRRWKHKILYTFCCDQVPSGTPLFVDGSLYGLTSLGGDFDSGTFYRLSPGPHRKWEHTLLYSFDDTQGTSGGSIPVGPLALKAPGKFLGTAAAGAGTLFSLTTGENGTTERALYSFCQADQCADGYESRDGVVVGVGGALFGVTELGGDSQFAYQGAGTIFKFDRGKLKQLHAFCTEEGCPDGAYPMALTADGRGNLFGVTHSGGNGTYDGTVFELTP